MEDIDHSSPQTQKNTRTELPHAPYLFASVGIVVGMVAFWFVSFSIIPSMHMRTVTSGGAVAGLSSFNHFKVATTTLSKNMATTSASGSQSSIVSHIKTPEPLKAIYMTSWVAGTKHLRERLVSLIEDTEVNAIVIDIKDYSGKIAFEVHNPELKAMGSAEKRIADIDSFIAHLHSKNIYVIGRVAVFQDAYLSRLHPEWSVRKKSDGGLWLDRKGLSWLDPHAEEVWHYTALIAEEAYSRGFDEINFDYIRFPSDGVIADMKFAQESVATPPARSLGTTTSPVTDFSTNSTISSTTPALQTKVAVMNRFFEYITQRMRKNHIPNSADLFGMTTVNTDDLNIGQLLEPALRHFDYVAPMVYPSHFPDGFFGMKKPADVPYELIYIVMKRAVERSRALGYGPEKLRPWLQDFNLGAIYTADMVRAQIDAVNDVGITSWMLWDPNNRYTRGALEANQ